MTSMHINDMRIGDHYVLDGRLVQCVALSLEMGRVEQLPAAAYRSDDDMFMWNPASRYRPATRADFANDIRNRYTSTG